MSLKLTARTWRWMDGIQKNDRCLFGAGDYVQGRLLLVPGRVNLPGAFASCAVCNTVDAADWIFCLDTKQVETKKNG